MIQPDLTPKMPATDETDSSPSLFAQWFIGYFLVALLWFGVDSYERAQEENAKRQQLRSQVEEMREAVRRGATGEATSRLFADDHAIYLERAQAGDPNVRPLDKDPLEYIVEQARKKSAEADR